jgi:hypothetical protein
MQTVYIGNTLINDIFLGSQRTDDVLQSLSFTAEYLVVAGGGGGGVFQSSKAGGGGGAGGLLSGSVKILNNTLFQVGVGAGGKQGINGSNSFFTGSNVYLVSIGGGSGGEDSSAGNAGGSGGGGAVTFAGFTAGGLGTLGQGNNGATGSTDTGDNKAGPGGGAGASPTGATIGGAGKFSSISGTQILYASGGYANSNTSAGTHYRGIGGDGGISTSAAGKSGGSGSVIIRYEGSQIANGGTVTTDGSYTIHTFTSSGTFSY